MKLGVICQKKRTTLTLSTLNIFFNGVRDFYKAVTSTILKKFSFNDHVFYDVTILLPENRCNLSSTAVMRLARRFSTAVPSELFDVLQEEVLDYKLSPQSDFPDVDKKDMRTMNCVLTGNLSGK